MASKTVSLRRVSEKTIGKLKELDDTISTRVIPRAIQTVAGDALQVAKDTLKDFASPKSTSQQLSPNEAIEQIGLKYDGSNQRAYIFAPVNPKYRDSMYFLEYGAGLDGEKPRTGTKINSAGNWIYPIENGAKDQHRTVGLKIALKYYNDVSKYKLRNQAVKFQGYGKAEGQWFGVTRTSMPIKYMRAARVYINYNARPTAIQAIKLYLQK